MATCVKISWDNSQDHLIQNPDNYTYEIVDPYIEGCKRYNVWGKFVAISKRWWRCEIEDSYTDQRLIVNGDLYERGNYPLGFNPKITFVYNQLPDSPQRCNPTFRVGWKIEEFTDNTCTNQNISFHWITDVQSWIHNPGADIWYTEVSNNQSPPIKLKIIDGNIEYLYSLVNKSSVQVIQYECEEQCPPGTLDCGDCCLSCDSVSSSLENIRNVIINL